MFRKKVRTKLLKKKFDLSSVLHETIQRQWEEIRLAMFKFPYFTNWTDQDVHQCCIHSNLLTFQENHIIRVKDDANVYVTYFILEGSITVVQRLVVEKYKTKMGEMKFKLHPDQTIDTQKIKKLESVFMQICVLNEGACFGLGEILSKHTIIANEGLKTLIIPKHIILQHFTPDNVWKRIILFLDMNYPNVDKVFEEFIKGRKWYKCRKNLVNVEEFKNRINVETIIHDVPVSIRMNDINLAQKFPQAKKDPHYLIGENFKS